MIVAMEQPSIKMLRLEFQDYCPELYAAYLQLPVSQLVGAKRRIRGII